MHSIPPSGFAKARDLPHFLRKVCNATYVREPLLTPSRNLFNGFKGGTGSWEICDKAFLGLMAELSR